MAAPSGAGAWRLWAGLVPVLLLFATAEEGPSTAEFDVRPGGMVHSFSRSLGDYTCTFTYASQGGTNEQWQMSIGVSEDDKLFSCSVWRPQGKSYLFFTQFKAEVKGAKIEYGMAYSQAATGGQSDVPLKAEEFEITETTVAHKEGKFRSELSKLVIVAKTPHDEL
ncbi:myeloid-derived growth factor [Mauremys mutica]|uniref:myeloid-derived growth factor n=1 Tax=Mauremys reevesii TaxID=260615 RepID=UPI00193EF546|nr:myeloid-derived growth factor [Mauremys reevesii]XP_044854827.1 myeloid-derived growth factor [Mauremys mutica]